jgi:hypothetical protein
MEQRGVLRGNKKNKNKLIMFEGNFGGTKKTIISKDGELFLLMSLSNKEMPAI